MINDPRHEALEHAVRQFLSRRDLESRVTLTRVVGSDGSRILALNPQRIGAARVDLEVSLLPKNEWAVDIYLDDDGRPIELIGPRDVNMGHPKRPTLNRILAILEYVAAGVVFKTRDSDGEVISVDVPDPDNYDPSQWAGLDAYEPWS